MHVGHRYSLSQTLYWSRRDVLIPLLLAVVVTVLYELIGVQLGIPWLPISLVGIAVAFYLGFKNNAAYDRTWEARKIWGAIVNASRSWAYGVRDLVSAQHGGSDLPGPEHLVLVRRHIAWMDALRHQLRKTKSWEHEGATYDGMRRAFAPEFTEDLREVLAPHLPPEELDEVLGQLNPAARLIANQSRHLASLRSRGLLDGFAHMELQRLLQELMTQQGKAERIKNFPFPRQYATVNSFFAVLFAFLVPFGMVQEFAQLGEVGTWLTIPFSTLVSWVFLTADRIGDWSENPFEGLANDVPISAMARGIERDVLQLVDDAAELPPARAAIDQILM